MISEMEYVSHYLVDNPNGTYEDGVNAYLLYTIRCAREELEIALEVQQRLLDDIIAAKMKIMEEIENARRSKDI